MTQPEQPMIVEESPEGDESRAQDRASASDASGPEQPSLFEEFTATSMAEAPPEEGQEPFLDRVLAFEGVPGPVYLGSLLIGSVLLMTASSLDLFPWVGSAVGVMGLLATMFRSGRWVTLACAVAVVIVAGVSLWPREPTLADADTTQAVTSADTTLSIDEAPAGSLGFRLAELTDLWNALDEPPRINRGFSRSSERGPLDGFVMRFDDGASLAGAYDPSDDYVYALWASSTFDHEAASTMYLHLCFMLHPYSQECIDAYWDEGLDGQTLADYLGTRHTAEWAIGEQTWRLSLVGNVQEIKVLGDPPA